MKNNDRGFIVPLILALIALLIAGGGIYVYTQSKKMGQQTVTSDNQQETSVAQTTKTQKSISNFQYTKIKQQEINVIQTGDVIRLTWNGCRLPKSDISLQLSYPPPGDGEKPKSVLIADNIQNTNEYDWKIPPDIETGEYRFYIGTNVCASSEFSEETIKIQQSVKPFIVFNSPEESETVQSGTTYTISWSSNTGSETNLDIGYRSTQIGHLHDIYWIAKNVKNTGSYSWVVPTNIAHFGWAMIVVGNTGTDEQVSGPAFLIN